MKLLSMLTRLLSRLTIPRMDSQLHLLPSQTKITHTSLLVSQGTVLKPVAKIKVYLFLTEFSVDVKEHLEYNGEYFMELSVGDVLFHPGMAIHQLGTIKVSGLKDAPIKGAWSSKYTQKVSDAFFALSLIFFSSKLNPKSRTPSASQNPDHLSSFLSSSPDSVPCHFSDS